MFRFDSIYKSVRKRFLRYLIGKLWQLHRRTQRKRRARLAREATDAKRQAFLESLPVSKSAELAVTVYMYFLVGIVTLCLFLNLFWEAPIRIPPWLA